MKRVMIAALAVLLLMSVSIGGMLPVFAAATENTLSNDLVGSATGNVTVIGASGTVGATGTVGSLGTVGASGVLGASGILGVTGTIGMVGVTGTPGASVSLDFSNVGYKPTDTEVGADLDSYYESEYYKKVPLSAVAISSVEDFASIANNLGGVYVLTCDIGSVNNPVSATIAGDFTGELWGNGYSITTTVPLFNKLVGATIRDLTIEGTKSDAQEAEGEYDITDGGSVVGALARTSADVMAVNVVNNASVVTNTAGKHAGGLIGQITGANVYATFLYCVNYAAIVATPDTNTDPAGIVSYCDGNGTATLTLEHCVNYGTITGNKGRAGGLAGMSGSDPADIVWRSIVFRNCTNAGAVTSAKHYAGGIAARVDAYNVLFENCVNRAPVSGSAVGGMFGMTEDKIDNESLVFRNCRNEADLKGSQVGGMAGKISDHHDGTASLRAQGTVLVENCVNIGNINCTGEAGGMLATTSPELDAIIIKNCYNSGQVGTGGGSFKGGMVAESYATVTKIINCTNTGLVKGAEKPAGGMIAWFAPATLTDSVVTKVGEEALLHIPETLVLSGCINTGNVEATDYSIAGIAGYMNITGDAVVENCYNSGNVVKSNESSSGIVDRIYAGGTITVTGCRNDGTITATSHVGGIAYLLSSLHVTVTDCINTGDITGHTGTAGGTDNQYYYAGGIVAYGKNNKEAELYVTNCINTGDVKAIYAAGVYNYVGQVKIAEFKQLTNEGTVIGTCANTKMQGYAGGIAVRVDPPAPTDETPVPILFENCLNSGAVSADYDQAGGILSFVGGDVAQKDGLVVFKNCLNTGNVSATKIEENIAVGGIVGNAHCNPAFYNCENRGTVKGNYVVGGILGRSQSGTSTLVMEGCKNTGEIDSIDIDTNQSYCGGLIGWFSSRSGGTATLTNCINEGKVTAHFNAGGMVALSELALTIDHCTNKGAVTVDAVDSTIDSTAGGMVGRSNSSATLTVKNSINAGSVSNMHTSSSHRAGGVTGHVNNKITVENFRNSGNISALSSDAGGVFGYANAIVDISYATNTGSVTAKGCAGGVAGYSKSTTTIKSCVNSGTITGSGNSGGIVGMTFNDGTAVAKITNCSNSGTVKGDHTGGILGRPDNKEEVLVAYCSNSGAIDGTYTGGIVGAVRYLLALRYCSNSGTVTATNEAGGILGVNYGSGMPTVEYCENSGTITGKSKKNAGGIVGAAWHPMNLSYCTNNGAVNGNGNTGGIIGSSGLNNGTEWTISNCVNNGTVVGVTNGLMDMGGIGGILGRLESGAYLKISNCINSKEVSTGTEIPTGGIVGNVFTEDPAEGATAVVGKLTLEYCANTTNGTVAGNDATGGLIGQLNANAELNSCLNAGKVDAATSGEPVGGMIGLVGNNGCTNNTNGAHLTHPVGEYVDTLTITNCKNTGAIEANNIAGGMIGTMKVITSATISNCTNAVDIASTGGVSGGLIANGRADKNLTISGCVNYGQIGSATVNQDAGGIIGYLAKVLTTSITISDCINYGDVYGNRTGGIFGANTGLYSFSAIRCVNYGYVQSNNNYCGGIAGRVDGTAKTTEGGDLEILVVFEDCVNNGDVFAYKSQVGGIIGYTGNDPGERGYIKCVDCVNNGKITGGNASNYITVGGMIGAANQVGVFENCVNNGELIGSCRVGGMIGESRGSGHVIMAGCINTGNVTNTAGFATDVTQSTGGLAGDISGYISVKNCVVTGNVTANYTSTKLTGENAQVAGGLVGYVEKSGSTFQNNYFSGKVSAGTGMTVLLAGAAKTGTVDDSTFANNFSFQGLPLYYHKNASGSYVTAGTPSFASVGTSANSAKFLAELNAAVSGGVAVADDDEVTPAFSMTVTCAGQALIVPTATLATFESAPAHNVAGFDYFTKVCFDSENHWNECPSCGTMDLTSLAAHTHAGDCQSVASCEACGYEGDYDVHNHTAEPVLDKEQTTADAHVYVYECCEVVAKTESHTWKNGACTVCGVTCEDLGGHTPGTAATCTEKATCARCGEHYGELKAHTPLTQGKLTYEGDEHWHIYYCSCGATVAGTHSEHSFTTTQQKDENGHWYEYTCECGATETSEVEEHDFSTEVDEDDIHHLIHTCDSCGYSCDEYTECDYIFSVTIPVYDPDTFEPTGFHVTYSACVCGNFVTSEPEACHGGHASCDERAICDICEEYYGEYAEHSFDESTYVQSEDESYHYIACTVCGAEKEGSRQDCYGGDPATCTIRSKCDVCHQAYGKHADHNGEIVAIKQNPDDHAHTHLVKYSCCNLWVEEEHDGALAATCQSQAVCSICNLRYGDFDYTNHVSSAVTHTVKSATEHNVIHICCGTVDTEAHSGGHATCSAQAKCEKCGTKYGSIGTDHAYDNACDSTCNDCGAVRTPAAHSFGDWTVTKQPTESSAGKQERTCSECGGVQTATIAAITNPNADNAAVDDTVKSDDYIGVLVIVGAGVIVLAVVVYAVIHYRNKKKK